MDSLRLSLALAIVQRSQFSLPQNMAWDRNDKLLEEKILDLCLSMHNLAENGNHINHHSITLTTITAYVNANVSSCTHMLQYALISPTNTSVWTHLLCTPSTLVTFVSSLHNTGGNHVLLEILSVFHLPLTFTSYFMSSCLSLCKVTIYSIDYSAVNP